MVPTVEPPVSAPVARDGRYKGTAATTSALESEAGSKLKSGARGTWGAN